jgi:hypothetical protein
MTFCYIRLILNQDRRIFISTFIRVIHRIVSPLIFMYVYNNYLNNSCRNLKAFIRRRYRHVFLILLLFNLRFPLLRRFISEIYFFSLILLNCERIILLILLRIYFFLPVLFSFILINFILKYIKYIFKTSSIYLISNFYTIFRIILVGYRSFIL